MSLLFDENLSPELARRIADLFPGSTSIEVLGMRSASDEMVWNHAIAHGLAVVTRDDDFVNRSALHGHPPKIIWIALGNCSTGQVESLLRWRVAEVRRFLAAETGSYLELR
jgi:predicted nuclease of predicted toxin-antitoxin system